MLLKTCESCKRSVPQIVVVPLECGHAVCRDCIDWNLKTNALYCGACALQTESTVDLTSGGSVTYLNPYVTVCEECEQNADVFCEDCSSFLCDQHAKLIHSFRSMQSHHLSRLADEEVRDDAMVLFHGKTAGECQLHPGHLLEFLLIVSPDHLRKSAASAVDQDPDNICRIGCSACRADMLRLVSFSSSQAAMQDHRRLICVGLVGAVGNQVTAMTRHRLDELLLSHLRAMQAKSLAPLDGRMIKLSERHAQLVSTIEETRQKVVETVHRQFDKMLETARHALEQDSSLEQKLPQEDRLRRAISCSERAVKRIAGDLQTSPQQPIEFLSDRRRLAFFLDIAQSLRDVILERLQSQGARHSADGTLSRLSLDADHILSHLDALLQLNTPHRRGKPATTAASLSPIRSRSPAQMRASPTPARAVYADASVSVASSSSSSSSSSSLSSSSSAVPGASDVTTTARASSFVPSLSRIVSLSSNMEEVSGLHPVDVVNHTTMQFAIVQRSSSSSDDPCFVPGKQFQVSVHSVNQALGIRAPTAAAAATTTTATTTSAAGAAVASSHEKQSPVETAVEEDERNRRYALRVTPRQLGRFFIAVLCDGEHLMNSPIRITVLPPPVFDDKRTHIDIDFDPKQLTATMRTSGICRTATVRYPMRKGKHVVLFRVAHASDMEHANMMFGAADPNINLTGGAYKKKVGYMFYWKDRTFCCGGRAWQLPPQSPQPQLVSVGDAGNPAAEKPVLEVGMLIDMDSRVLRFFFRNASSGSSAEWKWVPGGFRDLASDVVVPAVDFITSNDAVELLLCRKVGATPPAPAETGVDDQWLSHSGQRKELLIAPTTKI